LGISNRLFERKRARLLRHRLVRVAEHGLGRLDAAFAIAKVVRIERYPGALEASIGDGDEPRSPFRPVEAMRSR